MKPAISPGTPPHAKALNEDFELNGCPHHHEQKPRRNYLHSPLIWAAFHILEAVVINISL